VVTSMATDLQQTQHAQQVQPLPLYESLGQGGRSGGGGGNSNAPVYYLCVQHDMSAHVSEAMGWRLRGNYSVTLLWSLCVV